MTINTLLQIVLLGLSAFGIAAWLWRLRNWPLRIASVIALGANGSFLIIRETDLFTPSDLNLFSLVRILLLVVLIVAVPFAVPKDNQK